MSIRTGLALAATVAISLAVPAQAAVVVYYGADNGAIPGGPAPSAAGAAAAFNGAIGGGGTLINFEGASLPGVATGVTLTSTGAVGGGIQNTDQHTPSPLGFNTTPGGRDWLQAYPDFNSATGASYTFTFASAINSFGAYFTDTQDTFPGPITISFDDGTPQVLNLTKNDGTGGVLFFGFTDFGASFTSVTINTGATDATRDIWGIDDVTFANVPEPVSIALLGSGLLGLGLTRRRR